jgi:hypothetical protein
LLIWFVNDLQKCQIFVTGHAKGEAALEVGGLDALLYFSSRVTDWYIEGL